MRATITASIRLLFILTLVAISVVANILPEPFTTAPMRALPILLISAALFYWLWSVRGRRTLPGVVRHNSMQLTTPAGWAHFGVAAGVLTRRREDSRG